MKGSFLSNPKDSPLGRTFPMYRKVMFRALSLLTTLLFFGCTTDLVPATGEKRYLGFTWQQETEIGKEASQQVAALFGLYRDPKLERYVTDVGTASSQQLTSGGPESRRSFAELRLLSVCLTVRSSTPWLFPEVTSMSRAGCSPI
jgi:hypothetical protein